MSNICWTFDTQAHIWSHSSIVGKIIFHIMNFYFVLCLEWAVSIINLFSSVLIMTRFKLVLSWIIGDCINRIILFLFSHTFTYVNLILSTFIWKTSNKFPQIRMANSIIDKFTKTFLNLIFCSQKLIWIIIWWSSSRYSSMVSMAAWYRGGPWFKSWQGQEFINFWLNRKFYNLNLNTIIVWVYELTRLV